jgi:hypothetical protein
MTSRLAVMVTSCFSLVAAGVWASSDDDHDRSSRLVPPDGAPSPDARGEVELGRFAFVVEVEGLPEGDCTVCLDDGSYIRRDAPWTVGRGLHSRHLARDRDWPRPARPCPCVVGGPARKTGQPASLPGSRGGAPGAHGPALRGHFRQPDPALRISGWQRLDAK